MKNKKNKQQTQQQSLPAKILGISTKGKKIIFVGLGIVALGFFVLTKTDPAGQNLASQVSPFLLLGGYVTVGVGIVFPDKRSQD